VGGEETTSLIGHGAIHEEIGMQRQRPLVVVCLAGLLIGGITVERGSATTVIPIADQDLQTRADVIVHGVVVSNWVEESSNGQPVTVTVIAPLETVKGQLGGDLVLRHLGGTLPDGRFLKISGRPEYGSGDEVVVFAVERPDGDHQTAELLLGKFEVQYDETGGAFAVPSLATARPGVSVLGSPSGLTLATAPRELAEFLRALRGSPGAAHPTSIVGPQGVLPSIVAPAAASTRVRWNNGATAVWTLEGRTNNTGGGLIEAAPAATTWNAEPHSTINYTVGSGSVNIMYLDARSSPCGWNTCIVGGGVIGCGGASGGGTHTWRGQSYFTITAGALWLRAYCSLNAFDSITTQAVLTHELGHTLGLGHPDQEVQPGDVCPGDENLAQMRSSVQHRTTLGTDDSDAVRWLYGDGGRSCGGQPPPPPPPGGLPDLRVTGLTFDVKAVAAGGRVTIRETTRNQGQGPSSGSTTRYSLSTDKSVDVPDVSLGSRRVEPLASKHSSPGVVAVTIPAGTPPGRYFIIVRADADNEVAEAKETNNTVLRVITITP
jgi:hypothetical protein